MAQIDAAAAWCGYSTYFAEHLTFPPKGLRPLPGNSVEGDPGCFLWEEIFEAALLVNPAFDIYRIFDTVRDSTRERLGKVFIRRHFHSTRSYGTSLVSRTCYVPNVCRTAITR